VSEGFPNSIVEAMAAGKPVVCTDVGSCREAVVDWVTGFLVPPPRPDAFAGALQRLIADPSLRARMGEAGRARARQRHQARQVLDSVEMLYRALLSGRGAGGIPADHAAAEPAPLTEGAPLVRSP
jgi:D-inositol-3-phosphate glycosyltransferase